MTNSRRYLIYATLTTFTPLLVASALLWLTHRATFFDYVPSFSDASYHWHQAASFTRVGMAAGYYSADEAIPAASFSPYYAWALAGPVTYGVIGKVFGWTLFSGVLINGLFLTLAVAIFIRLTRLTPRQLAALALFLALYPPLLLYTPINMLELPHMALGLIMAGGFYRLIMETASRRVIILLGISIVLACWLRPTYGILWLPYWGWLLRRSLPALGLTAGLSALALWFYQYTAAPYVYTFGLVVSEFFWQWQNRSFGTALSEGLYLYKAHVQRNVLRFLTGDLFELVLRIQIISSVLMALRLSSQKPYDRTTRREMRFYLWYLGVGIAITLLVYNTGEWVDFRFFAAPCLLCVGVLIARGRLIWVYGLILLNVVALPQVWTTYNDWMTRSYEQVTPAQINAWHDTWQEAGILYDAEAPSRWCNTMSFSFRFLGKPDMLLGLEPGIGLSMMRFWANYEPRASLKSRYLLLTDEDAATYPEPDMLTAQGVIAEDVNFYINNAVACEP